jgi:hypothetical protein
VTFYALRSYRDNGQHYEGQLGDEATPAEFLRNLWAVMDECHRVLKASGSAFIELGEKFQGSGGHNNGGIAKPDAKRPGLWEADGIMGVIAEHRATRRNAPDSYRKNPEWARPKSLMGLPWAFVLGLINPELFRAHIDPGEHPQWILRAEIIWHRLNGLPESVTDRVRRSHSAIFHLTKSERYYSAVDEIREGQTGTTKPQAPRRMESGNGLTHRQGGTDGASLHPLGKLPGSVWSLPSEPLLLPDYFIEDDRGWRLWGTGPYGKPRKPKDEADEGLFDVAGVPKGAKAIPELVALWNYTEERYREGLDVLRLGAVDHFAAFGTEFPRRLILGFSPPGICTVCGEGRRPVVEKRLIADDRGDVGSRGTRYAANGRTQHGYGENRAGRETGYGRDEATILGYACACVTPNVPTRPSVVLDPFSGTGTTIGVAKSLGRVGVGVDLSADYCRLSRWRAEQSGHFKKAEQRTWGERQGTIL